MRRPIIAFALSLFGICAIHTIQAQQSSPEKPLGATAQNAPAYLKNAGIDQRLNSALPLNDHFFNETEQDVALGQYFGQRPVVMALVYFKCGMLCPQVLHGLAQVLPQTRFHLGHQYEVVVASIDPSDTPADAAEAKQHFVSMLGAEAAEHVHFLTGQQQAITDLAQATGFHYVRVPGPDGKMDQFAHYKSVCSDALAATSK
jgi:protein SCO1